MVDLLSNPHLNSGIEIAYAIETLKDILEF